MAPDARRSLARDNVATMAPDRQRGRWGGAVHKQAARAFFHPPLEGEGWTHIERSENVRPGRVKPSSKVPPHPATHLAPLDRVSTLPLQGRVKRSAPICMSNSPADTPPHSRGMICPSCASSPSKKRRAQGMPGARARTHSPVCEDQEAHQQSHYRSGRSPAFPAQWC
jgi:hypothetical protein